MTPPSRQGIVYLVGAGPGDPGLLTRRGAEVLARADLVAYDRLVHPELLTLAPSAELVDVGKQPGQSASAQLRINEIIVEAARAGKTVVRLKGGDPFVFGRGGEEAEMLAAEGIAFEVVPGVTSAVAGPAYAGIPLTHRDHASWIAIATGHEDPTKPESALDWDALAKAPTSVFLMGMERLGDIAERLQAAGMPSGRRAAVVEWATWPRQRVIRATVEKIADAVDAAGIGSPAILVVGAVTDLTQTLDWFERRPLSGKRVFVTRTRAQAGRLSMLLRDAGAEPLEFPAIKVVPPASYAALDDAIANLDRSDWVAFTSANAIDAFFERLSAADGDARALAGVRLAAIGRTTADALAEHGLAADLVPDLAAGRFTSEALARVMGTAPSDGNRVLVPQADAAPAEFASALAANGWRCESVAAYATVTDVDSVDAGRNAIARGVDAVLFTAGSTARNFVEMWGPPPSDAIVCCVGPKTAEVARELGIRVDAVAAEQTMEGLVAALADAVTR